MPVRKIKSFLSAFMEKLESFRAASKFPHEALPARRGAGPASFVVGNRPNSTQVRPAD